MIIKSLQLKNYRCFSDFMIDFDDKLTVLIGINGAGKTAVLDALSVFLKWAGYSRKENNDLCDINATDIAIGKNLNDVTLCLSVKSRDDEYEEDDDDLYMYLYFAKSYSCNIHRGGDKELINYLKLKELLENTNPVIVAYMASRIVSNEDLVFNKNGNHITNDLIIDRSFSRMIDYASTVSWFHDTDADEARTIRDKGEKVEFPELKAVRDALSKALLDRYERPRMSGSPPELIIYEKGTDVSFKINQLSDGYKAMLALVMDLARRMAQAQSDSNSHESILHTSAIVLIDEIELHLHPSWQQTVLNTLMDIFPNTQFIVTTHSPQVLSSIPSKHIRVLSDGKAYSVKEQTQGAEASRILKDVFGVDLRPNGLDIVQVLNSYTDLVYDEKWDTPEAKELRIKLDEHFGNDEPKLIELDLHIDNIKWERGL